MKNEEHTLVILTPGFPKDEADSTCLPFLQIFISQLNTQFLLLKVEIIAFDYPFTSTTYQWKGNTVHSFNGYKKTKLKKLFKWFSIKKKVDEIKNSNSIIGILSLWCGECTYIGNKYAKRNHLQHFSWILGQDAKKGNAYIKRIKPSSQMLIAVSDNIQTELKKNHGISPQHVIPIGIDITQFPKEIYERDIDILGAGSLIPLKQYDVFIQIIKELKISIPNIKTVLCGKGPEEKRLLQLIEKYDLQKNIILTGELSHAEILQQMQKSKVFLHTSNYEGFGAVCIEALYAGCQVISFVKPMNQIIENWTNVKTEQEIINKAVEILKEESIKYKRVLPFPIKSSVKKMMDLYNYKEREIS